MTDSYGRLRNPKNQNSQNATVKCYMLLAANYPQLPIMDVTARRDAIRKSGQTKDKSIRYGEQKDTWNLPPRQELLVHSWHGKTAASGFPGDL